MIVPSALLCAMQQRCIQDSLKISALTRNGSSMHEKHVEMQHSDLNWNYIIEHLIRLTGVDVTMSPLTFLHATAHATAPVLMSLNVFLFMIKHGLCQRMTSVKICRLQLPF